MIILVFGITGMLGHRLFLNLYNKYNKYSVYGCCRTFDKEKINTSLFDSIKKDHIITGFNIEEINNTKKILDEYNPDVIVNCTGCLKKDNPVQNIMVNALFPQQLYEECHKRNIYMIHISTDAVFPATNNMWTKDDTPSPDIKHHGYLYSASKLLGEVNRPDALTIRTCPIGFEITKYPISLLNWFIDNPDDTVNGFKNVYFNGITNLELCRQIDDIIHNKKYGILHISGEKINKYDLLCKLNDKFKLNKQINEISDHSLYRFLHSDVKIESTWDDLIDELKMVYDEYK